MRSDVLGYNRQLEGHLFDLQEALISGQWRHGPYRPFVVHDPKRRQIHKASVADRVVHQAVVNVLEPWFEKQFIYDSYSCRVGKGTHAAVRRLQTFLRQVSHNNTRTVYVLKCDVRKFFDSVDHGLLLQLLSYRIHDVHLLDLLDGILDSFHYVARKGLLLGNLTSQLFANVYLHELDRYVKFTLREPFYARYCDDFVVVHTSRHYLQELIFRIEAFLEERLALQLHPHKISIRTWTQGIDFLGYVLKPSAMLLRTKTKRRMVERVNEYNLASYLGFCAHANAYESELLIRHIVGKISD